MKIKIMLNLLVILTTVSACSQQKPDDANYAIASPDGKLVAHIYAKNSELKYRVERNNEPVLLESDLGIAFDSASYLSGISIHSSTPATPIDEHYSLQNGKKSDVHYLANEKRFIISNGVDNNLAVVFRLSNDGFAFRYELNNSEKQKFTQENSGFHFSPESRAWLQPMAVAKSGWSRTNPSYEEVYKLDMPVGEDSTQGADWVFPALFKTGDTWVLISEAGLSADWHGSRLHHKFPDGHYKVDVPQAEEVMPNGELLANGEMLRSPWRFAAVGDLKTVMESTLGTDLADPAIATESDYIQPGHASWSWAILKDDNTVYEVQKQFIDYAAEMHWDYTLIDAEWDKRIGDEKIRELVDYAATKGIGILLWYNSAGTWNDAPQTPRDALLTEEKREATFSKLNQLGVKGVKIDFFGGDGQSVIAYYVNIMRAAAKHKLLVNFHGATLPRGWQRTFPNLMTVEAIRGFEFRTFTQDNEDIILPHTLMSLFARNVFDPMDYTPLVFDNIPNINRKTSNSFELAESVLMQSGIQHFVEIPDGMAKVPEYVRDFLRTLPQHWDDVHFIDGEPGKWIVMARQSGNDWFVAGMNAGPEEKDLSIDLSFTGIQSGVLIDNGTDATSFSKSEIDVGDNTHILLEANSGFVLSLKSNKNED